MSNHRAVWVRAALATDLEDITRVQAKTMVAADHYPESTDEDSEFERLHARVSGYFAGTYRPRFMLEDRAVFVALVDAQIVGFIAGHRTTRMGHDGELEWMFVLPQWQRQGVGNLLFDALQPWFSSQGIHNVIVDAPPSNPCRAFYIKRGAVALDSYWLHWPSR